MTGPRKGQFWFEKPVQFARIKRAAFEANLITAAFLPPLSHHSSTAKD
jgi:hypothetical protein